MSQICPLQRFDQLFEKTINILIDLCKQNLHDPELLKSIRQANEYMGRVFHHYALQVRFSNQYDSPKIPGTSVVILGRSGSGKSSLINILAQKQVAPIGYANTTKELTCYHENDLTLFDTKGVSDDHTFKTLKDVNFLKQMSHRILVINHTLREVSTLVQMFECLYLSFSVVVTKCDLVPAEEANRFPSAVLEEIEEMVDSPVKVIFINKNSMTNDNINVLSSLLH